MARRGAERLMGLLPVPLRWHVQKITYLPFSRAVDRPRLPAGVRASIAERLGDDVECLRRLVGKELREWSV